MQQRGCREGMKMAGGLKLDEDGAARIVRAMTVHAANADEHARSADRALTQAVGALTSSPIAAAMEQLADRFRGRSWDISTRIDSLGSALTTTVVAIVNTDGGLESVAKRMER
jgi:hypothetical protein